MPVYHIQSNPEDAQITPVFAVNEVTLPILDDFGAISDQPQG
jgi:hypothetical protein